MYILAPLTLTLYALPAAGLDLDDMVFADRELGIRLEAPEGWTLYRQTGYPALPVLMLRPKAHAAIRLSVGAPGSGEQLQSFVADNRRGIEKLGLRVTASQQQTVRGRKVTRLDLLGPGGKTALTQLYLAHGSRALVLTLSAPSGSIKQMFFDLAQTVELLTLTRPSSTTMQPADIVSYPRRPRGNDNGLVPPAAGSEVNSRASSRPTRPEKPTTAPTSRPLQIEGMEPGEPP